MARSINGLDLQAAISGHLKDKRFKILEDEEWDHSNKIDFLIVKFPSDPKGVLVGVQVTARCNDGAKLAEFVARNDPNGGNRTVANKALYLEIEESVDINKGGADLVANILYAFQFDEQFADTKVWAATIQANKGSISYRFFDPRKNNSGEKGANSSPVVPGAKIVDLKISADRLARALGSGKVDLRGVLTSYRTEKGDGWIDPQVGRLFHMHINDVTDKRFSADLDALPKVSGTTPLSFQVLFEDGGKTRADASYNSAKNIRLLSKAS